MARFDCALWRPIGANYGGYKSAQFGLVLHHAVATGSLWSFFNNPSAQVSAEFWVSRAGVIEQYLDTEIVAWHGKQLNDTYCGVETEGCLASSNYAEPMPEAMVDALGRLYAEGVRRHGWVNALANTDGQLGFGYHRMAVNTACPCDVRLNRRSEILARAVGTPPTPGPVPKTTITRGKDGEDVTSLEDETFLHVWGMIGQQPYHWWQFLPGKGENPKTNWFVEALPTS
jgi:hypothetical protein